MGLCGEGFYGLSVDWKTGKIETRCGKWKDRKSDAIRGGKTAMTLALFITLFHSPRRSVERALSFSIQCMFVVLFYVVGGWAGFFPEDEGKTILRNACAFCVIDEIVYLHQAHLVCYLHVLSTLIIEPFGNEQNKQLESLFLIIAEAIASNAV